MKDWGIPPERADSLMVSDVQEIMLAEHAEAYVKQEQRERQRGTSSGSVSRKNYNASKSRQEAFGG